MKEIEIFEIARAKEVKDLHKIGINPTMYRAYFRSKEAGNELIDFNEVIWNDEIEDIVNICEENGISEFTISNTMSSLIETLAEFEKYGFKMNGLTTVYAHYTDFFTGKKAIIPAIKMSLK